MLKTLFALSLLLLSSSSFANKWCDLQATKEIQDYCYQHVIDKIHADEEKLFESVVNSPYYDDKDKEIMRDSEFVWEEAVLAKCPDNACKENVINERIDAINKKT